MEKKKIRRNQPYIIPPSFFRNGEIEKSSSTAKQKADPEHTTTAPSTENKVSSEDSIEVKTVSPPTPEIKVPLLNRKDRKSSGLSLNSIRQKKEHILNKQEEVIDPSNLPYEDFTEEEMIKCWKHYGQLQDKKGERIVGSMFAMNTPTLQGKEIHLTLPNYSMKEDLEAAQSGLLQYLYKKLRNYSIELIITVNEAEAKRYAFTPQDKYEKLREKNPLIDKLRSIFDLDI